MVKVCHMTSAHEEEDIRIFHKECVSLAEAGYEVYLVERGGSRLVNGVHIEGVGEIPRGRLKRMTEGAKAVYNKALKLDADIYHIHDPELLPYGVKLKKRGKKVIFDSHEHYRTQILSKEYLPKWLAKIVSATYGLYEKHVLGIIDGVIFPCTMGGVFPLNGKHKAIVDNLPKKSELYDNYDETESKKEDVVCLIGSLTYNRGLKHFIDAVYKSGFRALVGGEITPESFREEIMGLDTIDRIEFLGQLDRPQVIDVMNRSRVGVSAPLNVSQYDRTDNLATKVCEYMAMGLPVVLTRNRLNEKMIGEYDFGICVDPENVDEYAEAITFLLNNPEEARRLGRNGRKAVNDIFNWEKEKEKLLNLYEEILA